MVGSLTGDTPYHAIVSQAANAVSSEGCQRMRIEWRNVLPNRHSKSRIARVGKWTLIVVVAAFAVIGFLHLTRGTAVRHVRGVGEGRLAAGVSEPEVRSASPCSPELGLRPAIASKSH